MNLTNSSSPEVDSETGSPIENGVITDWDAMEALWERVFYQELDVDPSRQV